MMARNELREGRFKQQNPRVIRHYLVCLLSSLYDELVTSFPVPYENGGQWKVLTRKDRPMKSLREEVLLSKKLVFSIITWKFPTMSRRYANLATLQTKITCAVPNILASRSLTTGQSSFRTKMTTLWCDRKRKCLTETKMSCQLSTSTKYS